MGRHAAYLILPLISSLFYDLGGEGGVGGGWGSANIRFLSPLAALTSAFPDSKSQESWKFGGHIFTCQCLHSWRERGPSPLDRELLCVRAVVPMCQTLSTKEAKERNPFP